MVGNARHQGTRVRLLILLKIPIRINHLSTRCVLVATLIPMVVREQWTTPNQCPMPEWKCIMVMLATDQVITVVPRKRPSIPMTRKIKRTDLRLAQYSRHSSAEPSRVTIETTITLSLFLARRIHGHVNTDKVSGHTMLPLLGLGLRIDREPCRAVTTIVRPTMKFILARLDHNRFRIGQVFTVPSRTRAIDAEAP